MSRIERSALVGFSVRQIYALVNDVESYPQFMHGCSKATVLRRGEGWLEAELELQRGGVKQAFVTRNRLNEPYSISMNLVKGPFKKFHGEWAFTEIGEAACKVEFTLDFSFSNPLMGMMLNSTFEKVASEQVQSLCERAKQIYSEG